jgi:arsenate reductase
MEKVTIWHNPRYSKSRATFNLLEENNIEMTVIKYLIEPSTEKELKELLIKLDFTARDLMRKKEKIYKELDLKNEENEEKLITAMVQNPKLIERPIVIKGDKAVIGRPIDNVIELLGL